MTQGQKPQNVNLLTVNFQLLDVLLAKSLSLIISLGITQVRAEAVIILSSD